MTIAAEGITLRDYKESDIEDIIRWNTVETEWGEWDAPWENSDDFDPEEYRRKKREELAKPKDEKQLRLSFQLDYNGKHIGWVNSYYIDDKYGYTKTKTDKLAIGIDIFSRDYWGKGLGGLTFLAFIKYLTDNKFDNLYTQTWSGNERMVRMAERLGFEICNREPKSRLVRGGLYDGLTFRYTDRDILGR